MVRMSPIDTLNAVHRAAQHRGIRLTTKQVQAAIALIASGVFEVSDILSEVRG